MRLNRSLCILELEQRIAPAFTMTLNGVASFVFTDIDGDTVTVTRDAGGVGLIDVTDDNATGLGDFDEINSIIFNAGCDLTTTLSVIVTNSGASSDGIATVDYIDFTAPAAIGSIEIEGDVLGTLAMDPVASAVGDLDGDGNFDVVVANNENDSISVFMGSGNNTFTVANYDAGNGPSSVAIADLDGINNPDIVVTNSDGNTVSVFLNNGDGTFGAKTDYAAGNNPLFIAIADFDGVNNPDLVVTNLNDDTVSILINDGSGAFAAPVTYGTGDEPVSVAIGDLDGDGNLDLAVANTASNNVSILLGNGAGTFGVKADYAAGNNPLFIAIADFDGVNNPDLVVANSNDDTVSILINDGSGAFAAPVAYGTGDEPVSVAIGDLDGDGSPDLAVANYDSEDITILFNDGGGAFAPFTGDGPVSVVSADLNADGNMDLVVANSNDDTVSVLLGRGNGTFAEKVDYTTDTGPVSVAIEDLDNNNGPDLVVACADGSGVSVLLNNGDGTFGAKTDYSIHSGCDAASVAIADLDGDDTPDLAVASTGNWNVTIFLNDGTGAFTLRDEYTSGSGMNSSSIAIALLNGDDIPDLAVTNLLDHNVSIFFGSGTGTFTGGATYSTGVKPESVAVGDLDGDGDVDLATANWGDNTVSVFCNNGNGTFAAKVDYDTGSRPLAVSMEDLDGDGDKDLAVANSDADTVSIFFNNGDATFAAKVDYDAGDKPAAISLTDLDGDNDFDLVVAAEDSDQVFILYNNSRGIFGGAETYGTGSEPVFLVMGDFDGINGLDLAVVNRGSHCFSTLLNDGEGVFGGKTDHGQGSGDSITGSTINSLVVRSAQSADGGIEDPAAGGNVIASAGEIAIVLNAGLSGDINIEGAVTGGAGDEIGIHITGSITGSITAGDMTGKTIDQFDAGGDEGIDGATITITGNERDPLLPSDDLAGNLGGIRTDGGITDTTIDIAGDLDPSALGVDDAISTDWNDNGVGTITNATVTIGGNFKGNISNNQDLAGKYWPAAPNFQDMSLDVSVWGHFDGNIISGGSIIDSTFWADPNGDIGPDTGRMKSNILAFEDLDNITINTRIVKTPTTIAADAERQIEFLYGFSFPAPTLDDGGISNLQVTAASGGIVATISNDLQQNDGVGEDVEVTLNAKAGMVITVISANDLTMNAVGLTSRLVAEEISAGNNAEVNLDFSQIFDTTVEALGDLTMNVVVAGGTNSYPYFRPGVMSNVMFTANTGLIGGNFIGNISCEGNLHNFHISGYDVTLSLELTPNPAAGQNKDTHEEQTGERGDFLSGDIIALNDIRSDTGVGFSMNNFGATVAAGGDIIFGSSQVFLASASKLIFWDSWTGSGKDAGEWVTSAGTVMAASDIDVNFEFEATDTDGTLVLPPWYPDFRDDGDPDEPEPFIPDGFEPIPRPPEDLHVLIINADSDLDGNGTFSGSLTAYLGLSDESLIYGEGIAADITIEQLAGTDSDVDVYGYITAGDGGISGDIFLGGDLNKTVVWGAEQHQKLSCGGDFTGDFTLGGNLNTTIFIGGNSTGTFYIMGNIANAAPPNPGDEFYEVRITGGCNEFHVGGDIGPGTSPADTVFIRADSFQLLRLDGDVNIYVDILAGDEPGTGDIVTLATGGFVVPEHLDNDGAMIPQIRGNITNGGVPWPVEVGNRTVKLQLSDAIGGGTLKIRVRRGSATFFFMKSDDGKVDELAGVIVNEGTPSIYMKASKKNSDAVLGFMRAPAYQLTGADTVLFRSVKDLQFKNIDIEEITISGNARNIRIKNGDLEDCTIGDPDHPGEAGIGDLNSLLLQGSRSRGTGDLTGDLFVLDDLTNKLDAVNVTGSIVIGGDAKSISIRRDLEAPISVAGNLRNLTANRDVNGINQPINIGGDLVNFKAKRGPFTSTVEILGRLRGKFDMRGGANNATRTITFDPFAYTTTADYTSGGVLVVHDRVKHSRIR